MDLGRDDFQVYDSKKRQQVAEFSAESDLPLRIAMLIDTSNSIRDRFRFEQEAASEFIKSVIKTRNDRAMVVSFDTTPDMRTDIVEDTNIVIKAIKELRPGGGTALFDAIYLAC